AVADGRDLDQLFEDLFADHSDEEREAIQRKYGTKGAIFEAERLIEAKAADMLSHYVEKILPGGLKAQVVAYSRRAAVRYQGFLGQARDALVAQARALNDDTRRLDDLALQTKPRRVRTAVRAWRHLAVVESLEFAAIMSAAHNDPAEWGEWSDAGKVESRIARFKKPLPHFGDNASFGDDGSLSEGSGTDDGDPLAFLVVKSMLLTGFDAPIEGVMYLDRPIREAELLQAIARVNRTGHGKTAGILVDYYGVARHLSEALAAYSAEDIEGVLQSLRDEIPKLRDRHARVLGLFHSRDVDPLDDVEGAVELLADERLRAEFSVKLKHFLATLDLVLPRPEGLPFVRDAARLGEVYARARNRYRQGLGPLGKGIGRKVRRLIDEHVVSLGIDPKVPPIAITDAQFAAHVRRQISDRAKASEMEHAVRSHIRQKLDEDPVHYQGLSDRLEEILQRFGDAWEQLALALGDFVEEVRKGRAEDDDGLGLDPALHAPFFDLLRQEREREAPVRGADLRWLADLAMELVERVVRPTAALVGFWQNAPRQEQLRGQIFIFLDENEIVDFDRADAVADRLMELAKANQPKLVRR
ncbi:MAG: restriction endonuclease subunit R, partial [Acidobacteriota bacterium]